MNLLPTFFRKREAKRSTVVPLDFDEWVSYFNYNGIGYPFGMVQQTAPGEREEQIAPDYVALAAGTYESCGPVFACEMLRISVGSEARFQWQKMQDGRPGQLFGTPELSILEHPWMNATTGDLIARAILDNDLAGNFFAVRRPDDTLRRLRPDWTTIVLGSQKDPNVAPYDVDADIVGYIYKPGGNQSPSDPVAFLAEEVAHFMTTPDPEASYRGMSWLRPVIREIMGDKAGTRHKLRYFERGATPNMVVKLAIQDKDKFDAWVEKFKEDHEGAANAYKTLFLTAGADVEVVGSDLQQIEYRSTQSVGETRIAAAAGTPAVLVGLQAGLEFATYNNYPAARRRFTDGTMRPLWRNLASSLEKLIPARAGGTDPRKQGARLWYDDRDIPFLQEDQKDAGEVMQLRSASMRQLIDAGFEPDSVVDAVTSGDLSRLKGKHTGLFSVQLQKPGSQDEPPAPPPNGSAPDEQAAQDAVAATTAGNQGKGA